MATTAQIEANRRNCRKSTGPRTEVGKKKSKFNALDHGCRSQLLVLPSEIFGDYVNDLQAWRLSWKPRNPSEEFLIDQIVSLKWQADRIDQAHTARLTRRMHFGVFDEDNKVERQVIELGQKLFRDACGPRLLRLEDKQGAPDRDGEIHRVSDYGNAEDHPTLLVHELKASGPGCQWLQDQWARLRLIGTGQTLACPRQAQGHSPAGPASHRCP